MKRIVITDGPTPSQREEHERLTRKAQEIAYALDHAVNPNADAGERHFGFALLLFSFDDPMQPATWISNGNREDMIRAAEEWVARAKARQ